MYTILTTITFLAIEKGECMYCFVVRLLERCNPAKVDHNDLPYLPTFMLLEPIIIAIKDGQIQLIR